MKRVLAIICIATLLPLGFAASAWSGEIDLLLKKLVEKKVLTEQEAKQVLKETQEEVKAEVKAGKHEWLPKWVQNTTIKGDMRLRYQGQWTEGSTDRERGRIRLRLGLETKVNKTITAGLRLASGGSDPRSTNQTLQDFFSTKDIKLDKAYASFKFMDGQIYTVGGKFTNPIWEPDDLLWDGDITTEGAAASFNIKPFFANVGFFILDEYSSSGRDPLLWMVQPGVKLDFDAVDMKLAATGYFFKGIEDCVPDYSSGTNTRNPDSDTLKYNYSSVAGSAEIGFNKPFGGIVQRAAIYGTGIYNPDPSDDNYGWLAGLKFGSKKIHDRGDWQFKYMYRYLGKDAWLDTFPDSDFFDGETGVKGHEFILAFGIFKNTELGFDYYYAKQIDSGEDQKLLQVDLVTKF